MRWILAVCFVIGLCWHSSALCQQPSDPSGVGKNAALQYWQAYTQLPALDEQQQKILESWNSVSLDASAKKLFDGPNHSLLYLHRGSRLAECDWGLDYNDGIGLLLPHLAKSRDLARFAALHARIEFEQGNKKAARHDAESMMGLARHVGRDPIMVSLLVSYSIEEMTVDLMAPEVPDLGARYEDALALYEDLPARATLQQAVRVERDFFATWMVNKLKSEEKRQPGGGMELWKQMIAGAEAAEKVKDIQSIDELIKMCEDLIPKYEEMAELVALPQKEFDEQYPKFDQQARSISPMAEFIFPAVNKIHAKGRHSHARMAMLLAAIAVVESGPEKLQEIRDPFGDGPFEYRKLEKGFELKSQLVLDEQPVVLVVGQKD